MSGDTNCTLCHWSGTTLDLWSNELGNTVCPRCKMGGGLKLPASPNGPAAAAPSPLDLAIAGSTALDPAGNRRTAEQLKVPDQAAKDAEQARLAEYFRKNGVL